MVRKDKKDEKKKKKKLKYVTIKKKRDE